LISAECQEDHELAGRTILLRTNSLPQDRKI